MDASYCYEWNDLTLSPRDPYDEEVARRRHADGKLYTALLGEPTAPYALVEVRLETPWVGVHFLDDKLRRQVLYSFGSPEKGMLFLEKYRRIEFDQDGSKSSSETVKFRKDGRLEVSDLDCSTNIVETCSIDADVSGNWEAPPALGDYTSIARFERELLPRPSGRGRLLG